MNPMRKILVPGALALALAGAALAAPDGPPCGHRPFGGDPARFEAFVAKREAALHDKLQLKPDQEADWKAMIDKTRPGERPARPDWKEVAALPTPERLDRMLALSRDHQQRMETRAAAVKAFYATLSPEQRKVFDAEFMPGPGHFHRR